MPPEENLNLINNELYQEALRSMETSEEEEQEIENGALEEEWYGIGFELGDEF